MRRRPALRAPEGDGEVLAVPPLERAGDLVEVNRARLAAAPPLLGRAFAEVRAQARRELLAPLTPPSPPSPTEGRGGEQESPSGDVSAPLSGSPLSPSWERGAGGGEGVFLAGHQPELFHPGVWVKNFALAGLARRFGGTAVNLVVDNDTVKSNALRVPVPGEPPHVRQVPFDHAGPELPWEERHVRDRVTFDAFGDTVASLMRGWGFEPILTELWPEVRRRSLDDPIGEAFAAGRRMIERRWGCRNLEIPLSYVSDTESFAVFVSAILADVERFHALYNATVRAYRVRRHIRSRNHPVPDLLGEGGWFEVPLWGWRADSVRRGRLFVRPEANRIRLRAGDEDWPDLPRPSRGNDFVAAWGGLKRAGFKARPRALTTTLFARLFLADVFVHGIGGALYDELTDELMRRFFGVEPPAFVVLSATRWLPLGGSDETAYDHRKLAQLLRDLEYNPQRHIAPDQASAAADLLRQRREWVEQSLDTKAGRRERFRRLRALNEALGAAISNRRDEVRHQLEAVEARLTANAILHRRDYSFCLYPESVLRPFCERFL